MLFALMAIIFVIGYASIALEHPLKIDKSASALLTGVLCWTALVVGAQEIITPDMLAKAHMGGHGHGEHAEVETLALQLQHFVEDQLKHHLVEIAEIIFFLMGAMTIVELIDGYGGFGLITNQIKTTSRVRLMWILVPITFFMSAALDNLTTAIVMAALLRKLMKDRDDRWLFAGVIVIAANAGGAWSPIGDVTTIMLWVKKQVTAGAVVTKLIVPSIVVALVPLLILTFKLKGNVTRPEEHGDDEDIEVHGHAHGGGHGDTSEEATGVSEGEKKAVLFLGVSSLLFVPVFKTLTHLPPYMGVLLGLGFMWLITEFFNRKKDAGAKLSVVKVLSKIDIPSVLFFLGILLAVGSLQTAGHLAMVASGLQETFGMPREGVAPTQALYSVNILIGVMSAIVDNVPLVAGAQGMYEIQPAGDFATDGRFWLLLALCAGTGGSALIIGSAAGVAIMGILKIDFMWYLKKISWLALIGYIVGVAVAYLFIG